MLFFVSYHILIIFLYRIIVSCLILLNLFTGEYVMSSRNNIKQIGRESLVNYLNGIQGGGLQTIRFEIQIPYVDVLCDIY